MPGLPCSRLAAAVGGPTVITGGPALPPGEPERPPEKDHHFLTGWNDAVRRGPPYSLPNSSSHADGSLCWCVDRKSPANGLTCE